jgi:replication-associated recombination protein RarA
MDMFEHKSKEQMKEEAPLAARMRPANFSDFVGQ